MYESWVASMGGILGVAGVTGLIGNLKTLDLSVDPGAAEWKSFFEAWWDHYQGRAVGVSQLFEIASKGEMLADVQGSESDRSQRSRLGKALASRRDQTICRYHLERSTQDHKARGVYLLQVSP
jgi:hypothetical protein